MVTNMRSARITEDSQALSRRRFVGRAAGCLAAGLSIPFVSRLASAEVKLAARITAETTGTHVLTPAFKLAVSGLEALANVKDYEALFVRKELVAGALVQSQIEIKLRQEPFSVYLKFIEPNAGREVIYVDGKNDGKLLVHETGFASLAGTLSLDPKGSLAMNGNRYPVTMIGLKTMTETVIEKWLQVKNEKDTKVSIYPNATVGDLSCKVAETVLAKPVDGIPQQTCRLYVEKATGIPVRVQSLAFPAKPGDKPETVEDYFYSRLKSNVGLTDKDFDVENPAYGF
ncbi:hypothetical protein Pan44_37280 [Caulifigura coniformis]|uniref:DUF1571 domain-containing protein n=2 Tax=Caulifigura coniformis TaxID=2527983 RepID=A0A517SHS9_9PLAN|nr:hypothetical protein Pan44_37280 [Caulifigura coniformis]